MQKTLHNWADRIQSKMLKEVVRIDVLSKRLPKKVSPDFTIHFIGGQKMKALNFRTRKVNEKTDILSFEATSIFKEEGYLGELVICTEILKKQAKERKITPEMELQILMVHGFLHLLGFDHEKSALALKKMAALELKLLKKISPAAWIKRTKGRCLSGLIERVNSGT